MEITLRAINVPDYILPKPSQIATALLSMGSEFGTNFAYTFIEALAGMLIGSCLGFLIGICLAQNSFFKKMSLPFLIASNAVPIIAIAPILIIWFGNTLMAKIVVAAFISFFPIALNTFKGLTEFNKNYQELFGIYGSTRSQFLYRYKLGNAVPYILTGLKLNATLSVIGAVVGEFVSSDRGLGFAILQASYSFNSPKLWANILLTCCIGVFFYLMISLVENVLFKKFKPE